MVGGGEIRVRSGVALAREGYRKTILRAGLWDELSYGGFGRREEHYRCAHGDEAFLLPRSFGESIRRCSDIRDAGHGPGGAGVREQA